MNLSQQQSLDLMQKLARDDDFRESFQKDPVAALSGLGIERETLAKLDSRCASPQTLADKSVFEKLLADSSSVEFQAAMSFHVQHLRV